MRILLTLLAAPLLLAPVRLQDSTPAFFIPPAKGPAPESYSLPAAEPLTTPTVIYVSPSLAVPVSATQAAPGSTLNLPQPPALPPSPTVQPPAASPPSPNLMSPMQAALCQRALVLVQDIAAISYNQKKAPRVLKLSMAALTAMPEVAARQWPVLTAFNNAANSLPWFQPNKTELLDAAKAARTLCTPS